MEEYENPKTTIKEKIESVVTLLFQIAVLLFSALCLMLFIGQWPQWSQFAVGGHFGMVIGILLIIAAAALHVPKLARALSTRQKGNAFGAWSIAVVILVVSFSFTLEAFHKTPEGQKEKAAMDARDAADREKAAEKAASDAKTAELEKSMNDLVEAEKALEETAEQAKDCLSFIGNRLPEFEAAIKDQLHNPDAFEHIETVVTAPDYKGHNFKMQFRAENGFGALRIGTATAQVNINSCEVMDIRIDEG